MISTRAFKIWCAFNLLLVLGACGAGVVYRYYGADLPAECYAKGQLLGKQGKDGWPDLPLAVCQPDAVSKGKCAVQLRQDFFNKDRELNLCRQQLQDCQKGPPPS